MANNNRDETPEEFNSEYTLKKFDINLKEIVPNYNIFFKILRRLFIRKGFSNHFLDFLYH